MTDELKPSWYNDLPVSYRAYYDRAPEFERLSNVGELGLYAVRMGQLLQRLQGGAALANVDRLRELHADMVQAANAGNVQTCLCLIEDFGAVLDSVESEDAVWKQIFDLQESKSRVVDKEMKAKRSISIDKAEKERVRLIEVFFNIITAGGYIQDRKEMERLAMDIERKALTHVKDG